MRKAIPVGRLLASVLLTLAFAAPAFAQIVAEPINGFFGEISGDPLLVAKPGNNLQGRTTPNALTVAYDNTASAPNFGFSSTDLAAGWGDECFTVATGLLSTHMFTLFNAGTSAGALLTAQVGVDFYDGPSATFLGGYTTNVNFGTGLPAGFFSIVTVTGLDPLVINLSSNDLVVIQSVLSKTGAANRLGIASLNPITVGGSVGSMYINASTVGPAGFYNIGNPPVPAHPGYNISLAPPPVHTASKSWGELKKLYR